MSKVTKEELAAAAGGPEVLAGLLKQASQGADPETNLRVLAKMLSVRADKDVEPSDLANLELAA